MNISSEIVNGRMMVTIIEKKREGLRLKGDLIDIL